MGENV